MEETTKPYNMLPDEDHSGQEVERTTIQASQVPFGNVQVLFNYGNFNIASPGSPMVVIEGGRVAASPDAAEQQQQVERALQWVQAIQRTQTERKAGPAVAAAPSSAAPSAAASAASSAAPSAAASAASSSASSAASSAPSSASVAASVASAAIPSPEVHAASDSEQRISQAADEQDVEVRPYDERWGEITLCEGELVMTEQLKLFLTKYFDQPAETLSYFTCVANAHYSKEVKGQLRALIVRFLHNKHMDLKEVLHCSNFLSFVLTLAPTKVINESNSGLNKDSLKRYLLKIYDEVLNDEKSKFRKQNQQADIRGESDLQG